MNPDEPNQTPDHSSEPNPPVDPVTPPEPTIPTEPSSLAEPKPPPAEPPSFHDEPVQADARPEQPGAAASPPSAAKILAFVGIVVLAVIGAYEAYRLLQLSGASFVDTLSGPEHGRLYAVKAAYILGSISGIVGLVGYVRNSGKMAAIGLGGFIGAVVSVIAFILINPR